MSDPQAKRGHGCFFYGCIAALVLALILAVGAFFAVRYGVHYLIRTYTDTAPMALPQTQISTDEAASLGRQVDTFVAALKDGSAREPLVLTERDLNGLIATRPDLGQFRNRIHISLSGDQIRGTVSLPLEALGLKRFPGRYLNGSAAIKASLENGVLIVTLAGLEVKGKSIPAEALAGLGKENLARDLYRDPASAEFMRKLESVSVTDGRVVIKPKTEAKPAP